MSDRDALYSAILARPDEDTPRLAFADWLDEHGTAKDKKHAQLIRAQCELSKRDRDDPSERFAVIPLRYLDWKKHDPAFASRVKLEQLVPDLHMSLWKGLIAVKSGWDESFDRGFAWRAIFNDGKAFAEAAPAMCSAAPLQAVRFRSLGPTDAALAVRSPHWAQVRRLTVFGSLDASTVRALADTNRVKGIEAVNFDAPTTEALTALAESGRWSGLKELRLEDFPSTDRVLRVLAGSPLSKRLKSVWLTSSRVTSAGLRALAKTAWPELRVLYLWTNQIDDHGAIAFAESDGFPRLSYLSLAHSTLTGAGVASILSSPHLRELRHVELSGENVTHFNSADFWPTPAPALRVVNLTQNRNLDGSRVAPLFELLSRSNVVMLDLSWTPFGADVAKALAKTTGWSQLRALSLSYCQMPTPAAVALAGWAGLAGVERLAMDDNPIGQRGADAFAKSPHLGKLCQIITPQVTIELRKRFGKKLSTRDRMYS